VCLDLSQHECAGHHHDFFVRQRHVVPGANRSQSRPQADRADQRGDDQITRLVGRHGVETGRSVLNFDARDGALIQPLHQLLRSLGVAHGYSLGAELFDLLGEQLDVLARGQGFYGKSFGVLCDDCQRLGADAARATEDRETPHAEPSSRSSPPPTWALVNPKRRSRD